MADGSSGTGSAAAAPEPTTPRVFRPGEVLCREEDLDDPGSKGPFNVVLGGEETEIFLVRKDGKIRGYINVCPHRYMPLNWKDDSFLTFDKTRILCVVHAAIFEIEDGSCVTMHCMEGLSPVEIAVENGEVRLIGPGGAPVED
jgi:nitrite reductase/ring-hydroxylating ferredoxin subunit